MRRGTDRLTHRRPWPIYISPRLRLTRNVTSGTLEEQVAITFRLSRRRREMYTGHARLSVCLSVDAFPHYCISTLLHGPGCKLREWYELYTIGLICNSKPWTRQHCVISVTQLPFFEEDPNFGAWIGVFKPKSQNIKTKFGTVTHIDPLDTSPLTFRNFKSHRCRRQPFWKIRSDRK